MNFLEINLQMLQEAMLMRENLKVGKISHDSYMAQMGGMTSIGKMMDRHLRFLNFERINKLSLKEVEPDMIGYDPEREKVDCPGCGKQIERNQCLDYSGSQEFKECKGCETGKQTNRLLLPRK